MISERMDDRASRRNELICVVDATNQLHVLWHAGTRYDPVLALTSRLRAIQRRWQIERVVCAFDPPCRTFRHDLSPDYKGHRPAKPPDLVRFLEAAPDRLARAGFPIAIADGFEADDVLATIATDCLKRCSACVCLTADKDLYQVLKDGQVTIMKSFRLAEGQVTASWFTAGQLSQEFGLTASQWVDYQCLVGDPVDGLSGCPGIGAATARELLRQFGTIEQMLENPWRLPLPERKRDALLRYRDQLPLVRRLVTLRTDVPHVLDCLL